MSEQEDLFRAFAAEVKGDPEIQGVVPSVVGLAGPMLPALLGGGDTDLLKLARRAVAAWLRAEAELGDPQAAQAFLEILQPVIVRPRAGREFH